MKQGMPNAPHSSQNESIPFFIFKAVEDVFLSGPVMILSHEL